MSALALDADGTEIEFGAITDEAWWTFTLARPAANASATKAAITMTHTVARCSAFQDLGVAFGASTEVAVTTSFLFAGPADRGRSTGPWTRDPGCAFGRRGTSGHLLR